MSDLKSVLKKLGWSEELAEAFVKSELALAIKSPKMRDGGPQFQDVSNITLCLDNFTPVGSR